jgi:hypothetical protein
MKLFLGTQYSLKMLWELVVLACLTTNVQYCNIKTLYYGTQMVESTQIPTRFTRIVTQATYLSQTEELN